MDDTKDDTEAAAPERGSSRHSGEAGVSVAFGAAVTTVSTAQAALIDAVVDLVVEVRDRVLRRRGLVGTDLGRTAAKEVLAEAKRCAVLEVQVKGGYGVQEARGLVGLAVTPHRLRDVISGGMRRGEASWPLVQHFWQGSGQLTEDQRHLVATSLFGEDEGLAVEERRDADGRLRVGEAWSHAEFRAACDREVTAAEGLDVAAERERRRRAYAARTTHLRLHDDGTGSLSIRGPATTMAAIYQRIDTGARNARSSGDERTLGHARAPGAPGQDGGTPRGQHQPSTRPDVHHPAGSDRGHADARLHPVPARPGGGRPADAPGPGQPCRVCRLRRSRRSDRATATRPATAP